jgi:LPXTG-motif cell wall-anchored protein
VPSGGTIRAGSTVRGTARPGATVRLVDQMTGRQLCQVEVAADGRWSCALPADLAGGAELAAYEVVDGTAAATPFATARVTVAPAPSDGGLPKTGAEPLAMVVAALGLLAVGVVLRRQGARGERRG